MTSAELWQTFLQTGAPEAYILYNQAKRMEESHVFEDNGTCASGNELQ